MKDTASKEYVAAKKRVEDKKGIFIHILIYLVVNSGLVVLDFLVGEGWWFYWVTIGWGIGLAIHIVVYVVEAVMFSPEWEEEEIKKIMDKKK